MRVCLPRSSSTARHYAPPPSATLQQSVRQKRTLSDMSEEHARKAARLPIDLLPTPPSSSAPSASPVLPSPLPSGLSQNSAETDTLSSGSCSAAAPPAPARKRRAAAVVAESAIRQQLEQSDSPELRTTAAAGGGELELLCDEDESTIDSCVSLTSACSAISQADTTAYITPEPRKRRSRRRRKAEADASTASTATADANAKDDSSSVVIPTYLPPAVLSAADDALSPPLRRSSRRLPKAHSLVPTPTNTSAPTALPRARAASLPALHPSAHPIFHDCAILASVMSGLSLSTFLRLRCVSSSFLRASYTPSAWLHQHFEVCDAEMLSQLCHSSALFALLPSLTINLVSCQTLNCDADIRNALTRLPSLRRLRLLNCMKLTQAGVNGVLYCSALTELTVQNCGSLSANSLHDILQPLPTSHHSRIAIVPILPADSKVSSTSAVARSGALSAYRSAAYLSALSSIWSADRPLYDVTRLVALDLTKYRNFRDESLDYLKTFPVPHPVCFTALRHLNLRGCRELTDVGMGRIARMSLHSLDLSFCVQLTNKGMELLADVARPLCQTLTSLNLTSVTLLTDGACQEIAQFEQLTHLVLSQLPRLTDHGLILLQRGPACLSLQSVVASWCDRLVGDWLVSVGEGWTRDENDRRMGADFLDYYDAPHSHTDSAADEGGDEHAADEQSELRDCDSDGDGIELADARREAAVIARRREAQRQRRQTAQKRGAGVVAAEDDREMWSALRHVDVRYCHGIDVGSKVILSRLRSDVELVWR